MDLTRSRPVLNSLPTKCNIRQSCCVALTADCLAETSGRLVFTNAGRMASGQKNRYRGKCSTGKLFGGECEAFGPGIISSVASLVFHPAV